MHCEKVCLCAYLFEYGVQDILNAKLCDQSLHETYMWSRFCKTPNANQDNWSIYSKGFVTSFILLNICDMNQLYFYLYNKSQNRRKKEIQECVWGKWIIVHLSKKVKMDNCESAHARTHQLCMQICMWIGWNRRIEVDCDTSWWFSMFKFTSVINDNLTTHLRSG